ncbi:MAG TPA: hypothetical protein VIM98_07590 [Dyella sp.]|uniref:hypothetical protein n=1 Tax=Dyella sp. TaxID=1869338 RepID=UPI002F931B43
MKRKARQRIVLLLGVAVLVMAAAWQWQRDRQQEPGTLLSLDPAEVTRIGLQFQQAPMHRYSRHDDGHWWTADEGPAMRADDGRLAELSQIAAAAVLQWRPLQDFSPQKIGLAPPLAVLELDGRRVEFGETSVTGPQRYVRVDGRVALVPLRYTPRPMDGKNMPLGLH